jgi:hypothetical protein
VKRVCLYVISVVILCCTRPDEHSPIGFESQNGKAVAIRVSTSLLPASPSVDSLEVSLGDVTQPVLGTTDFDGDDLVFTPIVPLSPGLKYSVYYSTRLLGTISIEIDREAPTPSLVAIYPSGDTIPENILKMYLHFSHPMVEGNSLSNIVLLRNEADTIRDAFLDLQPELWNENSTTLTLWLDPGRIKRHLIPNRTMGNPLQKGSNYSLTVLPGWRSKSGMQTVDEQTRNFLVGPRDERSPSTTTWKLDVPKGGTHDPLVIRFSESLDYLSAENSIYILKDKQGGGHLADGQRAMGILERSWQFVPASSWQEGEYTIEVELRLEDLAGNNLTRLFDRDLTKPGHANLSEAPIKLHFVIL